MTSYSKKPWDQSVNYIKKLKILLVIFRLFDLKIIAYMGLLIYWATIILATFLLSNLKVTKSNKVKFSPHQIAFHVKHPRNTFILVETLDPRSSKHVEYYLFPGSGILALEACGLKLEALATGLEACSLLLDELGA